MKTSVLQNLDFDRLVLLTLPKLRANTTTQLHLFYFLFLTSIRRMWNAAYYTRTVGFPLNFTEGKWYNVYMLYAYIFDTYIAKHVNRLSISRRVGCACVIYYAHACNIDLYWQINQAFVYSYKGSLAMVVDRRN